MPDSERDSSVSTIELKIQSSKRFQFLDLGVNSSFNCLKLNSKAFVRSPKFTSLIVNVWIWFWRNVFVAVLIVFSGWCNISFLWWYMFPLHCLLATTAFSCNSFHSPLICLYQILLAGRPALLFAFSSLVLFYWKYFTGSGLLFLMLFISLVEVVWIDRRVVFCWLCIRCINSSVFDLLIKRTSHSCAGLCQVNWLRCNKLRSPAIQSRQPVPVFVLASRASGECADKPHRQASKSAPRFLLDPSSSNFPRLHLPKQHRW